MDHSHFLMPYLADALPFMVIFWLILWHQRVSPTYHHQIKLWMLGSGRLTQDAGPWALDPGLWILDAGFCTLDAALWTLDSRHWTLDSGHWTLETGLWALESGRWMLHLGRSVLEAEHCGWLFHNRVRAQFLILLH